MGSGESIVKYILFIVNLCFALAGLALLALGVVIKLQLSVMAQMPAQLSSVTLVPYSLIVIGSIVFCIAFFGCCGAIREHNCMLIIYSTFMVVLMIISACLAILIFVKLDEVIEKVPELLEKVKNNRSFHDIESKFECCGTRSPLSYGVRVPESCCASKPCTIFNAYPDGCYSAVADYLRKYGSPIGGILVGVAAIELVGAVFGFCLANHLRNNSGRFY